MVIGVMISCCGKLMLKRSAGDLPVTLSVAGFDPSGGAGIIADVRTFTAFDCFATAAVTSVTSQNTTGVFNATHLSVEMVRAQVLAIVEEKQVAAVKTGMLPTREIVSEVARLFRETNLPAPVVDPVIRSTSGYALIEDGALETLIKELLPLARVVTPNIPEAETITGLRIVDEEGMHRAAQAIRALGARAALIKGGHLMSQESGVRSRESEAIDVLDDGGQVKVFRGEWIDGGVVRGTGCRLSAAIAAGLGKGKSLEASIEAAKRFVAAAIRAAHISEVV